MRLTPAAILAVGRPVTCRLAVLAAVPLALAAVLLLPDRHAHAQATTEIWSAILTVGKAENNSLGYCSGAGTSYCGYGGLSDTGFTLDGTNYTVESIRMGGGSDDRLHLTLDRDFPNASLSVLALQVGSHRLDLDGAARGSRGRADRSPRTTTSGTSPTVGRIPPQAPRSPSSFSRCRPRRRRPRWRSRTRRAVRGTTPRRR